MAFQDKTTQIISETLVAMQIRRTTQVMLETLFTISPPLAALNATSKVTATGTKINGGTANLTCVSAQTSKAAVTHNATCGLVAVSASTPNSIVNHAGISSMACQATCTPLAAITYNAGAVLAAQTACTPLSVVTHNAIGSLIARATGNINGAMTRHGTVALTSSSSISLNAINCKNVQSRLLVVSQFNATSQVTHQAKAALSGFAGCIARATVVTYHTMYLYPRLDLPSTQPNLPSGMVETHWDHVSSHIGGSNICRLSRESKDGPQDVAADTWTGNGGETFLSRQFASDALSPATITTGGIWYIGFAVSGLAGMVASVAVHVMHADGTLNKTLQPIVSFGGSTDGTEQVVFDGIGGATVTIKGGDYLLLEMGVGRGAGFGSATTSVYTGGNTPCLVNSTPTSDALAQFTLPVAFNFVSTYGTANLSGGSSVTATGIIRGGTYAICDIIGSSTLHALATKIISAQGRLSGSSSVAGTGKLLTGMQSLYLRCEQTQVGITLPTSILGIWNPSAPITAYGLDADYDPGTAARSIPWTGFWNPTDNNCIAQFCTPPLAEQHITNMSFGFSLDWEGAANARSLTPSLQFGSVTDGVYTGIGGGKPAATINSGDTPTSFYYTGFDTFDISAGSFLVLEIGLKYDGPESVIPAGGNLWTSGTTAISTTNNTPNTDPRSFFGLGPMFVLNVHLVRPSITALQAVSSLTATAKVTRNAIAHLSARATQTTSTAILRNANASLTAASTVKAGVATLGIAALKSATSLTGFAGITGQNSAQLNASSALGGSAVVAHNAVAHLNNVSSMHAVTVLTISAHASLICQASTDGLSVNLKTTIGSVAGLCSLTALAQRIVGAASNLTAASQAVLTAKAAPSPTAALRSNSAVTGLPAGPVIFNARADLTADSQTGASPQVLQTGIANLQASSEISSSASVLRLAGAILEASTEMAVVGRKTANAAAILRSLASFYGRPVGPLTLTANSELACVSSVNFELFVNAMARLVADSEVASDAINLVLSEAELDSDATMNADGMRLVAPFKMPRGIAFSRYFDQSVVVWNYATFDITGLTTTTKQTNKVIGTAKKIGADSSVVE